MSGGYTPKRKTLKLVFDDEEFDGLVVKVGAAPMRTILKVVELLTTLEEKEDLTGAEITRLFNEMFGIFADALVSWNVEDDGGNPVPTTVEGITSQDSAFIMAIINTWAEVLSGVSTPLGKPSPNGERSPEELIPMEALSESQPNSLTQTSS
jgi:hypothetical protein